MPPASPGDASPVPGVDYRVVVVWASAVGGGGLLVATAIGFWVLRPESRCRRRKPSRVAPTDKVVSPTVSPKALSHPALALQDAMTKQQILAIEHELLQIVQQKQLLEDIEDVKTLKKVTLREEQLRQKLSTAQGHQQLALAEQQLEEAVRHRQLVEDLEDAASIDRTVLKEEHLRRDVETLRQEQMRERLGEQQATLRFTSLQGALALEESPAAPGGTLALQDTGHSGVAQGVIMSPQEMDAPSRKRVRGFREGHDGEWRHW